LRKEGVIAFDRVVARYFGDLWGLSESMMGKKNNVVVDYCSGDFEQPVHCSSSWKPNGGFSQFSSAFSEFRVSLFLRQSLALSSMFVIPILDG
jgi:hypothetical protein